MDDSISGNHSSVPTVVNIDAAMVERESVIYRVGVTISVLTSLPVLLAIFHTYRQNSSERTRNVGRMMVIMGLILFLNLVFNVQHIVLEGLIKHVDSTGTVFKPTFWCTIQAFLVQNTFVPSVTLMACFSFEINALLSRGNTTKVDNRPTHYIFFTLAPALLTSILFFALGKFGPSREWHFKNGSPNYGDFSMCWVNLGDPFSWFLSYLPGVLAALVNVCFLGCIYRHLYNASHADSAARSHFNSILTRMSILPTATFLLWIPAMLYFVVSRTETTRNRSIDDTGWEPWLSYLVSACFSLMACVQSVVVVFSNKKVYDSLLFLFSCCPNKDRRYTVIQDNQAPFLLSDPEQFTTDESSFSPKTIQTSDEEDSHVSYMSDGDDFGPPEDTSESLSLMAPREHIVHFSRV